MKMRISNSAEMLRHLANTVDSLGEVQVGLRVNSHCIDCLTGVAYAPVKDSYAISLTGYCTY